MASLTVLKFETPEGAGQMLDKMVSLQKQQLIKLQDAATVTWPEGKKALKGEQFELIASKLTKEQEDELMAAFSVE
mgnify:CR=1 FL=1